MTAPDINIVDYSFHEKGNGRLEEMNSLNQRIYEQCSYKSGPVYTNEFITSKTALTGEEYGDTPRSFVEKFGIKRDEWDRIGSVSVLRSSILTQYLVRNTTYEAYWANFMTAMKTAISRIHGNQTIDHRLKTTAETGKGSIPPRYIW